MEEAAGRLRDSGDLLDVRTGFRAPIPGWWPGAGDVDLVVEQATKSKRRWDLYELKWCNHNKMEEALWDLVKLLNAHQLPQVRNTYLVFAAPTRWWEPSVPGTTCFQPGRAKLNEILFEHDRPWARVLSGGKGRPQSAPAIVDIELVGRSRFRVGDVPFEIRAVAIRPAGSKRLELTSEVNNGSV